MKTKRFSCSIYAWTLFVCAFGLVSCHDLTIDNGGYLSMMNRGTIVGNDEDGYYLFSDGRNEVAICYGKGLDKYERAYYSLSFKEENRFFSDRTPGFTIIDNARVGNCGNLQGHPPHQQSGSGQTGHHTSRQLQRRRELLFSQLLLRSKLRLLRFLHTCNDYPRPLHAL